MTQKQNTKAPAPTYGLEIVNGFLSKVKECAITEGTQLSPKDIMYASNIIASVDKKLRETQVNWKDLDVVGCRFPQQVKRYARLGLSLDENEIYVDIRYNSKTELKDINIKKQYQGLEKEIMKFCTKKVVRFFKDIVCVGDEFVIETDFNTGLQKVTKHNKDMSVDRNKLENIIGAYQIAYVEENGTLNQYLAYIDKNRIMRAYNASPSREKSVWNKDTRLMVLKTATHTLYNNVMKPYMQIPTDLLNDWKETQDVMEFEENGISKQVQKPNKIDIDEIDVVEAEFNVKENEEDEANIDSEQQ